MEPEIDINILVNLFVQKLAAIQKENTFLEAKYQTLLKEYYEVVEVKNDLQTELTQS